MPPWLFAALAVAAGVVLAAARRGAAGRDRLERSRRDDVGIRVSWVVATTYALSARLAALAGLVDAANVGDVDAELSRSLNLDSVAAAVIGGVALTGGEGTIARPDRLCPARGAAVWMLELGAGGGGQLAVEGAVILLAVCCSGGELNTPQEGDDDAPLDVPHGSGDARGGLQL